ncbi:MAG: peptidase M3 [Planctomycetaceae bacterium]|nr:peptidase M3 [Planctomycetaceae bacterium]
MSETNQELDNNPLLVSEGLPRFDEIEPEHIVPAIKKILADVDAQLTSIEENIVPTWAGLMEPLEQMDVPFEYAWRPVSHLHGVKNSAELREAYDAVSPDIVTFGLRCGQSKPLYEGYKAIRDGDEWASLNDAQQRIIEKRIQSSELSGIGLEGEERERFNEISQELSQISTDFSNNVLDATKAFHLDLTDPADVEGMPSSLLALMAQASNMAKMEDGSELAEDEQATPESGPWRVTLDIPCLGPFLEHCQKRELREQVYRAFITRASSDEFDNSGLIPKILRLRAEKSKLLGFDTFADLSLASKMAPSVPDVEKMFETLRSASWDAAQTDLADVQALAKENGFDEQLRHWDIGFWAERLRESRFDYTDEEIRPYFPLDRALTGMFELVERIFGIQVVAAEGEAPIWNPDVRFFKIADQDGTPLAAFYLDPYSRPADKRGGAWMDECMVRRRVNGEVVLPVAHLVCNGTPPVGDTPSLMTFREVETLFHEFGHGLQHMLTTIDEADASGINGVEWDAVELPSQFMENWCYHRPTLMGISGHYETGEPLPDDLFQKLCAARTYRAGTMMLRQLLFGMTDMTLHSNFDPDGDQTVFEVQRSVSQKTSVLPQLEEDRSLCAFQHIFSGGYAAGYYSYKWAEVLSADAFNAFEEAGLDDEQAVAETGRRFRDTVLALGGSQHPMEVFKAFRGREPSPEPLLKHNGLS